MLPFISLSVFAQDNLTYDKLVQTSVKSGSIDYFIQGKGGAGEKNNQICEDGLFSMITILPFLMERLINLVRNMTAKKEVELAEISFKMFSNHFLLIQIN